MLSSFLILLVYSLPAAHAQVGQDIVAFAMQAVETKYGLACISKEPKITCSKIDRSPRTCDSKLVIRCEPAEKGLFDRTPRFKFKISFHARDYDGEGIFRLAKVKILASGQRVNQGEGDIFASAWLDETEKFLDRGHYTCEKGDWKALLGLNWFFRKKIDCTGPENLKIRVWRNGTRIRSLTFE